MNWEGYLRGGKFINRDNVKYIDEDLYKKWMKDELEKGDIIMTSEAPVGELYYINENVKYCLSQRL